MPNDASTSRLGLLNSLLQPIQKLIHSILSSAAPSQLAKGTARESLVLAVDQLLVRQFPLARLVPPEARRGVIRKQLDIVIDEILLNDALPKESIGTGFESFILTIEENTDNPAAAAEKAVRSVLGPDWIVRALPLNQWSFEAVPMAKTLSVQEAWNLSYQLKKQPSIAQAEANIIVPLENLPADEAPPPQAKSFFGTKHLPQSAPNEWSLDIIKVKQAWQKATAEGRLAKGEGVLVGHPDTGYTRHAENWSDDPAIRRLLFEFGWDFWKGDSDPTDDLESSWGTIFTAGMVGNPGHGTGTSSIIFSAEGPSAGSTGDFVSGVAPRAKLIPFRVAPSVLVWDQRRLADAIKAATDAGCHVISISMGGLPLSYLEQAVIYATEHGVIVCAAEGNVFGANDVLHAVVWPAAYNQVLAVAASNAINATWSGSSRGPQVDITAPGESVWHAIAKKGKPLREVARGSGTSFAVATTAGVASLWLAYHGRDQLIATYGKARLPSLFRQILVTQGFVRPANWKTDLFGAGIIDALRILSAALPPPTAMAAKSVVKQARFDQFASLFDDVPRVDLRRGLAELLHTPDSQLPARLEEVGDELLFHFFSDSKARENFRAQISPRLITSAAKGKGRAKSTTKPKTGVADELAVTASPILAAHLHKAVKQL